MPKLEAVESTLGDSTKKYLLVRSKDKQYGIEIGYVENVVRVPEITRVPGAQDYFIGIISLRGEIIAVMSLRLKMKQGSDVFTDDSRIVIINLGVLGCFGILADEVRGMVQLKESEIDFQVLDMDAIACEKEYTKYGGNAWENLR